MLKRTTFTGGLLVISFALIAEVALRLAGIVVFPTYQVDDVIGYIPAPNQSGVFLNKNRWEINERSMGSSPWQPDGQHDLLLLGDSLVWGGNSLDQPEKLGQRLQVAVGDRWRVWSASAGSWSVLNELAYLDRFPDVQAETDTLVWALNSGDFSPSRSLWSSDNTHPRDRPTSALAYALGKYALTRLGLNDHLPSEEAQNAQTVSHASAELLKAPLTQLAKDKQVLVVLYPDQTELSKPTPRYEAFKAVLTGSTNDCCSLLELRAQSEWKPDLYRDNIHPTPQGNEVFARLIHQALERL